MKNGTRFTDKFIMNLKPDAKDYWVREGMGFCIRVYPSGEKTWYYIYTFDGRKRFMKLKDGGYPDVTLADAREAFDIAKVKVKNGVDPWAEKQQADAGRKEALTVKELAKEFMEKHAQKNKRESTLKEDVRIFNKDILPHWGNRKADSITKRDVNLLLQIISDRAEAEGFKGIQANNTFKRIRKMFNWAIEQDILLYSPCVGVKTKTSEARDRVLEDSEIKTLWQSLAVVEKVDADGKTIIDEKDDTAAMSPETKTALKLILLTAQRPSEVTGMHRQEIKIVLDEKDNTKVLGAWWTIPPERSKNKIANRVWLTNFALELIGDKDGYIFESPREGKPIGANAMACAVRRNIKGHRETRDKASRKKDAYKRTGKAYKSKGVQGIEAKRIHLEAFTPHDLRRTAATKLSELGYSDEIVDAVLNHAKRGVIKIYNRNSYDKEKIIALEALTRKLTSIVTESQKKDNVVSITRKAAW